MDAELINQNKELVKKWKTLFTLREKKIFVQQFDITTRMALRYLLADGNNGKHPIFVAAAKAAIEKRIEELKQLENGSTTIGEAQKS